MSMANSAGNGRETRYGATSMTAATRRSTSVSVGRLDPAAGSAAKPVSRISSLLLEGFHGFSRFNGVTSSFSVFA
jgi:hypothetical protein